MNYEEKYKMALETVQEILSSGPDTIRIKRLKLRLQSVFPELAKSEDGRIRKMLRAYIHDFGVPKEYFKDIETSDVLAWLEKQGEQSNGKIEPKFKVKYAGSEYNVFEIKESAGVTYYGIEDDPNHIDYIYIKADNCEIINGGYGVKEDGSYIPTKPAIFSEKKKLKKIEQKKLDPDKVIEWLDKNANLFGAKWCHAENIVEQFKRDFGL